MGVVNLACLVWVGSVDPQTVDGMVALGQSEFLTIKGTGGELGEQLKILAGSGERFAANLQAWERETMDRLCQAVRHGDFFSEEEPPPASQRSAISWWKGLKFLHQLAEKEDIAL